MAASNQEKALVGAFSVITNLRMELFQALVYNRLKILRPHLTMFQPTCSTSKLPSKYQTGGPGLFYKRYRRPQSCKYDTYRTR